MKNSYLTLSLSTEVTNCDIFLCDPKSDFLVICGERVWPLHTQFLSQSQYFAEKVIQNSKVHLIDNFKKPEIMENAISLLYGMKLRIQRSEEILDYLAAISLLRFEQDIIGEILSDMWTYFDDYSIFTNLSAAVDFKDERLEQRCWQQLIDDEFEQVNYNRFSFFRCSEELFTLVLSEYQQKKMGDSFEKVDRKIIEDLVSEYCEANFLGKKGEQRILNSLTENQTANQVTQLVSPQSQGIRPRNSSWGNPEIFTNNKITNSMRDLTTGRFLSSTNLSNGSNNSKRQTVSIIKELNQKISEKNQRISAQLEQIRDTLSGSCSADQEYDKVQEILEDYEKVSTNQTAKVKLMQEQIKSMLEKGHISSTSGNSSNQSSPYRKRKDADEPRNRRYSMQVFNQRMPIYETMDFQ